MRKRTTSKAPRRRSWPAVVACLAVLACGFFFAARQHFASMDFGMKNSRLRKQIDDLESEKRRLLLAREVSLSPNEIKKAAAKVATSLGGATAEIASAAATVKDKLSPAPAAAALKTASSNPLVEKTVASSSTAPKAVQASAKLAVEKQPLRTATVDKKLVARVTTAAE